MKLLKWQLHEQIHLKMDNNDQCNKIFLYFTFRAFNVRLRSWRGIFPFKMHNLEDSLFCPTLYLLILIVLKCVWREVKTWLKFNSSQSDTGDFSLYNLCRRIKCLYSIIWAGNALLQLRCMFTNDSIRSGCFCEILRAFAMLKVAFVLVVVLS